MALEESDGATMAMRHDKLSEEQLEVQRAYKRSWDTAQHQLADPEFREYLEASIEGVNRSSTPTITREDFILATAHTDEQ